MWPFSSTTKLDAGVQSAWGRFAWIGLDCYFERIKQPGALYNWAKKLASMADKGETPVMIAVSKDRPAGQDRTSGRTVWWDNWMRLTCPAVPGGVEILRASIESFDRPIHDLPSVNISEKQFKAPGEAIGWCNFGTTWRCLFNAKPSPTLTAKPRRQAGDPVSVFGGIPAASSVAFNPDGTRVAFAFFDKSESGVYVGDALDGKLLLAISPFPLPVNGVAFSPNGQHLGAGFGSRTGGPNPGEARVWNATTGAENAIVRGHRSSIIAVAFSPDSMSLATGSSDTDIRLWNVASGKQIALLSGHKGGVQDLAFSPDGKMLASGSQDQTCRLWDVQRGQFLRAITGHTGYVTGIAFGPNHLLGSSSLDGSVRLWRADTGQAVFSASSDATGFSVGLSADGKVLAYGTNTYWSGGQPTLRLFRTDTKQLIGSPRGADLECNRVAFSPDGKRVAAAFGDLSNNSEGAVKVWETQEIK